MNSEQSCHVAIQITSQTLTEILKNHLQILNLKMPFMVVSLSYVTIDTAEDYNLVNVPESNKQALSAFCDILKRYLPKESKPILKQIKKDTNTILSEIICDWRYVETCVGELAKQMAEMESPDPMVAYVEKYIFDFSYKNNISSRKEYAVYKDE